MSRVRQLGWAAAVAAAAAAGIALMRGATPTASDAPPVVRLSWPADRALVYHLEHDSRGRGSSGGAANPALSTTASIDAELVIEPTADPRVKLARFAAVERASITVAGREQLEHTGALTAPATRLTLGDDGRIAEVAFTDDAGGVYRSLVQFVFGELQLTPGAGRAWSARERSPHGSIDARYRARRDRDGLAIERERVGLTHPRAETASIDGAARFALGAGGVLERVDSTERVEITATAGIAVDTRSHTAIELIRAVAAGPSVARAFGDSSPVGALGDTGGDQRGHLEQRAAGLDRAGMIALLARHGRGGKVPDHNQFLVRATAVIRLDPGAAAALEPLFEAPANTYPGRALICDLLAQAGTPEAQASLRRLLAGDVARGGEGYSMLYQRLGLVRRPTAETLAMAREHRDLSDPLGGAGALTYGAVLGGRVAQGDGDADREVGELFARAATSDDPAATAVYLRAVGNTGLHRHTHEVLEYVADPSPVVRQAVATALRATPGDDVDRALVGLAGDPETAVQAQALRSLERRVLDGELTTALADQVRSGRTASTVYQLVVEIAARAGSPEQRSDVFRAVIEQPGASVGVRSRARAMLDNPELLARN